MFVLLHLIGNLLAPGLGLPACSPCMSVDGAQHIQDHVRSSHTWSSTLVGQVSADSWCQFAGTKLLKPSFTACEISLDLPVLLWKRCKRGRLRNIIDGASWLLFYNDSQVETLIWQYSFITYLENASPLVPLGVNFDIVGYKAVMQSQRLTWGMRITSLTNIGGSICFFSWKVRISKVVS